MAASRLSATKKIGRPATGIGTPIQVRLHSADLSALDTFIETAEGATRPAAIRAILSDWLATHGFKIIDLEHTEPSGPATEAIRAMEVAIEEDKRGRKSMPKRP